MHDTLNAEGASVPIEEQMAVEGTPDLDATDAGELRCGKVAANQDLETAQPETLRLGESDTAQAFCRMRSSTEAS